MRIAVIGSSGGMGAFFVGYFLRKGHQVTGFDIRGGRHTVEGFKETSSCRDAVAGADAVLVATSIDSTLDSVREFAPELRRGACVMEITSLKVKVLRKVRSLLERRGAILLSLHPLFGPSLPLYAKMKICVVSPSRRSMRLAKGLFPDANLIPIGEKEHERMMGVILSLTHLLNIAYAATVARHLKPQEFRRLESPTSAVQLSLAEGILTQNPALYSYIQVENQFSAKLAGELIDQLAELRRMVIEKDRAAFEEAFSTLARVFAQDSKTSLKRVYEAFDVKQRR